MGYKSINELTFLNFEGLKKALMRHGIKSWSTLMFFTKEKFTETHFGIFGKGKTIPKKVFGLDEPYVTEESFNLIAEKLGWFDIDNRESKIIKLMEIELKKHKIVSSESLTSFTKEKFFTTEFGPFGKGKTLARKIFGIKEYYPTEENFTILSILISKKLGWLKKDVKISKEEIYENKKNQLKLEFAKHGITSYTSLLNYGTIKFRKSNFGPFKGRSTVTLFLLGRSEENTNKQILKEIAEKLGWVNERLNEDEILAYKNELAKHDIYSCAQLIVWGGANFRKAEFGKYGDGKEMYRKILAKVCPQTIDKKDLYDIAHKLGWTFSKSEMINLVKDELVSVNVSSYETLMNFGVGRFINHNFGIFDGGISLAKRICQDTNFKRPNIQHLVEIANYLGWERNPLEEEVITDIKLALSEHKIISRQSLQSYGPLRFRKTIFDKYGNGDSLKTLILGKILKGIGRKQLNEIATVLGW